MEVSLIDATGASVAIWRIAKAVPIKFSGPSLNAAGSEVAIETLEVMAIGITYDAGTA